MADLEDAYSDLSGGGYSLPTGTSGLSSYGQRLYGRQAVSVPSIDTDLQTERSLLALEQQKSGTIRQLRDTALASLNLREKNRVDEQAGYIASSLSDLDPRADDFEDKITTLYSQYPYGFKDPSINKAIDYKRDIRKQFDTVKRNLQEVDTRTSTLEMRQRADALRKEENGLYSGLLKDYYSLPSDAPIEKQREALTKAEDIANKSRIASNLAAYGVAGSEEDIIKKFATPEGEFDIGAANKELKRRMSLDKRLRELDPIIKGYEERAKTGFPPLTPTEEQEWRELRDFRSTSRKELLGMGQPTTQQPVAAAAAPVLPQLKTLQDSIAQYNDWFSKWGGKTNIPEEEKTRGEAVKSALEKAAAPINFKSPGNAASLEEKKLFIDTLRSIPTDGVSVQFKIDGKPTKWVKARRDLIESFVNKQTLAE